MAVRHAQVWVADQPIPLNTNETGDPVPGRELIIRNRSAVTLELGGDDLTWGQGFPLDPDDATSVTLEQAEILYAIGPDAGPYEVRVLRTGAV